MGLFRGSRPSFRAIADALGLLQSDAATSEYENGPVRPILDVQASIEAGVDYSEFILLRTDPGGGADTTVDVDVHVLADWTEIRNRGVTQVGVAGSEVPAAHDAWIIRAGVMVSSGVNFTSAALFTNTATVGAGTGAIPLWFGDSTVRGGAAIEMIVNATLISPFLLPVPWWVPPVNQQLGNLQFRLLTSGVVSTNLILGVLSAPQGTFKRLY